MCNLKAGLHTMSISIRAQEAVLHLRKSHQIDRWYHTVPTLQYTYVAHTDEHPTEMAGRNFSGVFLSAQV